MTKLDKLRQRASETKKVKEQQVARIKDVVIEKVKSPTVELSALKNLSGSANDHEVEKFATDVAEAVAEAVVNPTNEFLDVCKSRGLSDYKIKKVVTSINGFFHLVEYSEYDQGMLDAVALYFKNYPHMYDDMQSLL